MATPGISSLHAEMPAAKYRYSGTYIVGPFRRPYALGHHFANRPHESRIIMLLSPSSAGRHHWPASAPQFRRSGISAISRFYQGISSCHFVLLAGSRGIWPLRCVKKSARRACFMPSASPHTRASICLHVEICASIPVDAARRCLMSTEIVTSRAAPLDQPISLTSPHEPSRTSSWA